MLAIGGAPLDEVWNTGGSLKPSTQRKTKPPAPRQRQQQPPNIPTKVYDDIIDAYLEDFQQGPSACSANTAPTPSAKNRYDTEHVKRVNILPDQEYYDVSPYFQEPRSRPGPSQKCKQQVQPLASADFVDDAMEYQRFFKGDNMFPTTSDTHSRQNNRNKPSSSFQNQVANLFREEGDQEDVKPPTFYAPVQTEEEGYGHDQDQDEHINKSNTVYQESSLPYVLPEQHPETRIIYTQTPPVPVSPGSQYLELALYIFSGIILIFLLEQILHLGLYLR